MRSGLAISRLVTHTYDLQQKKTGERSVRIISAFSNAWDVVYLSHIYWDIGEMVTLSAFIEMNDDGSLKLSEDKKHYKWKGCAWAVAKVSLFAARILCLVTTLHNVNAFKIKQTHLSRIYVSIASIWTLAMVGALIQAVQKVGDPKSDKKQNAMEIIKRTFDLSALVFDLTSRSNSACGIASSLLNLGAGLSALAYEFTWHRAV